MKNDFESIELKYRVFIITVSTILIITILTIPFGLVYLDYSNWKNENNGLYKETRY